MNTPDGGWRITDGDRHSAVEALGEHYATGRLDKSEYDERADRALAAKTNLDLGPIFADLPGPHGLSLVPAPAPRAATSRPAATPERRGFHGLPPFVLVPMIVLGVGLAIGTGFFWMLWWIPALFWFRFHRHGYRRHAYDGTWRAQGGGPGYRYDYRSSGRPSRT